MGGRIKSVAIVLMLIGLFTSIICFFIGNSQYNENKDYIEYATVNGGAYRYPSLQKSGDIAYAGLMMRRYSLFGIIGSIFGMLPLYLFGCLFEHVEETQSLALENKRKLDEIKKKLEEA